MILSKEVVAIARRAVEKCGTREPFEIAKMCRAELIIKELGSLKGFYKIINNVPFIFINKSLSAKDARLVCAHELGHHALHREFARVGFEEFSLFCETSRREYEANLFAAELLIDDEALEEFIEYGYSQNQIAAAFGIEEKLVQMKLNTLKKI